MTEALVFIKPATSVIGPNETIISPFKNINVWGESELGIVLGKKLVKATVKRAQSAIFGYTIGNDVSCENIMGWDHHLARSKGADTFCVLGPWIDTEFNPQSTLEDIIIIHLSEKAYVIKGCGKNLNYLSGFLHG